MIGLILISPVLLALLVLLWQNRRVMRLALLAGCAVYSIAIIHWWLGFPSDFLPGLLENYFQLDAIGLYFLTLMVLVFIGSAVYSLFFLRQHGSTVRHESYYISAMLLFVAAMSGVILSTHLALLWVFIEATTLSSAVLIYFDRKKSSLEATWKYVFICSVGIALAFVGIILLSIGSRSIGTLFFADLYAHAAEINPFWLKISFAFILVGFGTKIGIAPIHAWLPDAHSEAPSPVSALLSGTLLNTALLGMIRVQEIMNQAHLSSFADTLLLVTGFMSMLISAVFMLNIINYKRMLAYSSIENMGILFIALTQGKTGIHAAIFLCTAHSLAKASLFLTSGNILHLYGSKRVDSVQGLLRREPVTGWIWIISMLAIAGLPPFPAFLGKFMLIQAFFETGDAWMSIPFFLLMIVIMYGMGSAVLRMAFGENPRELSPAGRLPLIAHLPQIVFLLILLAIGAYIPQQAQQLMIRAADFLSR